VGIRAAPTHFDFVAGECNKGLGRKSVTIQYSGRFWGDYKQTVIEQAIERSGTKAGIKVLKAQ